MAKVKVVQEKEKIVLYVITDREPDRILSYFRAHGIYVAKVFNSIEDARNKILMLDSKCRIVVIETGLGMFSSMKMKKELIDMLGICDENNHVSVYYVDTSIKSETLKELGKQKKSINWNRYYNIYSVVKDLSNIETEEYIQREDDDEEQSLEEEQMKKFKGAEVNTTQHEKIEIEIVKNVSIPDIIKNTSNTDMEEVR